MNSKRIHAIAKFINNEDKVIDVGCDHGYLGIYLKLNNICQDILLTDISSNALNSAIENIKKYNVNIDTKLTDGLNDINLKNYNTITISGMGTNTIIEILSKLNNNKTINKLIIQSNNNLDILRSEISKLGYYLTDEIVVFEQGIYYIICEFLKGNKELSNSEIFFGINKQDKKEYYEFLINQYNKLLGSIPPNNKDYNEILEKVNILNNLLKESR